VSFGKVVKSDKYPCLRWSLDLDISLIDDVQQTVNIFVFIS